MTAGSAGKVRELAAATAWRAGQSGRVVFTNGVFDLLHPGHVELLEAARREGDALIVGVNSDGSARRLAKGPERPVAGEQARARVLAGLAAVDCVVLFDQNTPLELIQALAPDVLVKGADYTRDRIVGADWVEARGGRVVRVPVVPGYSTTAMVERLRAPS
ncbi:MAG TPA: D-glycero-beta-D-manno-heptose 1-phosphate adenylyltransferase [Gemmatimonadales bacterium]|nr:D-glycero-beta-D-manno-heptose 1-phosphate adenylyltransferase [Gemmatimonadales bacterium]